MTQPRSVGPVRLGPVFSLPFVILAVSAALGTPRVAVAVNPAFSYVSAVTDGQGGAVFAWADSRNPYDADLYAGRIASDGTLLWISSGRPICTVPGAQNTPRVLADGQGGAFLVFPAERCAEVAFGQHPGAPPGN